MDLGISKKVALVSAASKGLGKAIALELSKEGAFVGICARTEDLLIKTKEEIERETGNKVFAMKADITIYDDIKKFVNALRAEFGPIDILVTNAGGPPAGEFFDFEDKDWEAAFNLNLMSVIRLIREVVPDMKEKKWGRIINMSSISVKQPIANLILSNVIRAGVIGLTKSLSNDLAKYNILVNSVAPGYIMTERVKNLVEANAKKNGITQEEVISQLTANISLGRVGAPPEIGAVVAFLASERANYITGQTILVDGGMFKGLM
ncbi:MAG TPA: SDR family oxidoreductase [Candidatus Atribacteria bacterium]|nr:SDR family oxidoreductase [Candidatus Atribacteria bacterium]